LLDWTKLTDLLIGNDQFLAQPLEVMKLGNLLLRFAQSGWIGKSLCYRFAAHPPGEAKLRIMAGVIRFGTMASRFAAAPDNSGNRTTSKIT